ncbi:MAG TPA: hypothetical protein ENJ21_05475 [Chromatiaceae bacterium]|nr:hypothetical protein [Chromatiaceae bacterium]
MSHATSSPDDAAWVTIDTPLGATELKAFLEDIERLFRINPLLEFESWRALAPDNYHLTAKNLANGQHIDTDLRIEPIPTGLCIHYSQGLKNTTTLRIIPVNEGTKLEILDDYSGTPEAQRKERLDEVDRSLLPWGQHLHAYLKRWKRWSWFGPWRWYTTRVWQNMKPSARRVSHWIIWISAAEFIVFLMVFSIFWLERQ